MVHGRRPRPAIPLSFSQMRFLFQESRSDRRGLRESRQTQTQPGPPLDKCFSHGGSTKVEEQDTRFTVGESPSLRNTEVKLEQGWIVPPSLMTQCTAGTASAADAKSFSIPPASLPGSGRPLMAHGLFEHCHPSRKNHDFEHIHTPELLSHT